jgi:erythromycin esterase-like protein
MSDAEAIREIAQPLTGSPNDYDMLLGVISHARFVLLGEASRGTHEFYFERAAITKRLIAEKGFTVIAIEADWPRRKVYFRTPQSAFIRECSARRRTQHARRVRSPDICRTRALCGKNELCL